MSNAVIKRTGLKRTLGAPFNTEDAADWTGQDLLTLCKPRVVVVMLACALVGMALATPALPPLSTVIFGLAGIGFAAGGAAAFNHVVDRRLDAMMLRTSRRPLASQRMPTWLALAWASLLSVSGILLLLWQVNALTAWLTLGSLIGYALIYTAFLKRATPQNIVIGGVAGAAPPLLGWTAVTGQLGPEPLLLLLIVFAWTPPHFWALGHLEERWVDRRDRQNAVTRLGQSQAGQMQCRHHAGEPELPFGLDRPAILPGAPLA
ncbi:UbiA family prenyltransferase [Halomonas chromatireducens]|uniref:Protoheme IX farnesyltransferase n=1 Tax=Halomonas chromatireducens TaxID=507626 RepID=A0A0X8HGT7_9GAMM|nr:UbiA family prenyltransferase [Halomonas chromatireducens]AMD02356.1 Protoheme IX farnesyltransferase 1 [Halomonas chromatireducens]